MSTRPTEDSVTVSGNNQLSDIKAVGHKTNSPKREESAKQVKENKLSFMDLPKEVLMMLGVKPNTSHDWEGTENDPTARNPNVFNLKNHQHTIAMSSRTSRTMIQHTREMNNGQPVSKNESELNQEENVEAPPNAFEDFDQACNYIHKKADELNLSLKEVEEISSSVKKYFNDLEDDYKKIDLQADETKKKINELEKTYQEKFAADAKRRNDSMLEGYQDVLNQIKENSEEFKKDWQDVHSKIECLIKETNASETQISEISTKPETNNLISPERKASSDSESDDEIMIALLSGISLPNLDAKNDDSSDKEKRVLAEFAFHLQQFLKQELFPEKGHAICDFDLGDINEKTIKNNKELQMKLEKWGLIDQDERECLDRYILNLRRYAKLPNEGLIATYLLKEVSAIFSTFYPIESSFRFSDEGCRKSVTK